MSELAELLELLHEAHSQVDTFQAEYRDWTRPRPSLELKLRSTPRGGRLSWEGAAGPFPRATSTTRRIWLARPDRLRVEIHGGHRLMRFGVLNRRQWWWWDMVQGEDRSEAPGEERPGWNIPPLLAPPLLDPVKLLAALRFQPAGRSMRAGRQALSARAKPRHAEASDPKQTYKLEFDAENGTLLFMAALEEGHCVGVTEALDVDYNVCIEPSRFTFVAPDGKPVRHKRQAPGGSQRSSRANTTELAGDHRRASSRPESAVRLHGGDHCVKDGGCTQVHPVSSG
jgi:hypothetical protein